MNSRVKNCKHIPGIMCTIVILVLASTTGCNNRKVEDLQAKLLQEKENTIRFSIEKETAAKDSATLKTKLESLELALSQSQEKQKRKEAEIELLNTKLSMATNHIVELEAKAITGGRVPSSTFKVGSSWWERYFDKLEIKFTINSSDNVTFKVGDFKVGLLGQANSLTLRIHLGTGSISTANRWNNDKMFSPALKVQL